MLTMFSKYALMACAAVIFSLGITCTVQYVQNTTLHSDVAERDLLIAKRDASILLLGAKIAEQSSAIVVSNSSITVLNTQLTALESDVAQANRAATAINVQNKALLSKIAQAPVPNDWPGATAWSQTQFNTLFKDWK